MGLASFLLGGYTAVISDSLDIIRNVLTIKDKSNKYINITIIVLALVLGLTFNRNGLIGLLPILTTVLQSYIVLQKDSTASDVAFVSGISIASWTIFNIFIKNYVAFFMNIINTALYLINSKKNR